MTGYPDTPGAHRVDTSIAAADAIATSVSRLRAVVLRVLHQHPAGMTVEETCAAAGYKRYSLQPRFCELRIMGLIRDTGKRRTNESGRRAIVWRIVANDRKQDAA